MHTTGKKTGDSRLKTNQKSSKDDTAVKNPQDERLKKNIHTPRNYVQKSTTADIYAQKKKNAIQPNAPKKLTGTHSTTESPMKNLLKSSPSSTSQISTKSKNNARTKIDVKVPISARQETPRTKRDLPFTNVTVKSPVVKRKAIQDGGKSKLAQTKEVKVVIKNTNDIVSGDRQRSKTRTLNETEVKVLTPDGVDNNAEMQNLSRKLTAKPKAFYVELEESKANIKNKPPSEDEVSYEDDFESYESDFDSYQETASEKSSEDPDDANPDFENNGHLTTDRNAEKVFDNERRSDLNANIRANSYSRPENLDQYGSELVKDIKDEEKMLDSGNYDLRDSRSATKAKSTMGFILEDGEQDVRSSLTDEGFQDMSSSAVSSMKTVHTDVLERPIFIDFTKSKENKRKRRITERLKQRAKDILSMVTLHEMSYSLFEMKPIPYEIHMATFGRSNYSQCETQTYDDGISEEIQTNDIEYEQKWTQYPVKFSKSDVYLKEIGKVRKYSDDFDNYITKFSNLLDYKTNVQNDLKMDVDDSYKRNPLRMYFEQKDGAGSCTMWPYKNYETKLKNHSYNTARLGKFLKRIESKISSVLSKNIGAETTDLIESTKYSFSKGYKLVSTKSITDENMRFLKQTKITSIVMSETKNNLLFTIHSKRPNDNKNFACLWDVSVAIKNPLKVLISINNIAIARYHGNTDGILGAALDDGSLHVWDLSEQAMWCSDAISETKTDLVEVRDEQLTPTERDREWNSRNINTGVKDDISQCLLQASAYTTSGSAMRMGESCSPITSMVLQTKGASHDGSRKYLGQIIALQRIGIITIWSILQYKLKNCPEDIGKAHWSKIRLENNQTISLLEHLGFSRSDSIDDISKAAFSLNAAKMRLSSRKKEKRLKRQLSQSRAVKSDRPTSAAILKNETVLPHSDWETGMICTDLKVMRWGNKDYYLVGKNCGEVLCCTKCVGVVKVNRFQVADLSTITSLEVSPELPVFLAATDTGTIGLCSLLPNKVLLSLDCRNMADHEVEKYHVDTKGRFLGSTIHRTKEGAIERPIAGTGVQTMLWSSTNPCCVTVLLQGGSLVSWDLALSDIHAKSCVEKAAITACHTDNALALLTWEGEVQIHKLPSYAGTHHLDLFKKYVALL